MNRLLQNGSLEVRELAETQLPLLAATRHEPMLAAKRRKNEAHGISRGENAENTQAQKERKSNSFGPLKAPAQSNAVLGKEVG